MGWCYLICYWNVVTFAHCYNNKIVKIMAIELKFLEEQVHKSVNWVHIFVIRPVSCWSSRADVDSDLRGNIATIKIIILNNNNKLNYVTINGFRPKVRPIKSGIHGYETQAKHHCRAKTQRNCSKLCFFNSWVQFHSF